MRARDRKSTAEILERLIAIGDLMEPQEREEWLNGKVVQGVQDIYTMETQEHASELFGSLLLVALAKARPLPAERPPLNPHNVASMGHDVAEAIRDLDRGRTPPRSSDWGEAIQRLADFVVSVPTELRWDDRVISSSIDLRHLARAALSRRELVPQMAIFFTEAVGERWPHHSDVTIHRFGFEYGDRVAQTERASRGGRAPRRSRSAAAILIGAVLSQRPGLRGETFGALVAELRGGDTWGDVSIDNMAIAFERGGARKRGWAGSVRVYVGTEEPREVKAKALERAFERARKET